MMTTRQCTVAVKTIDGIESIVRARATSPRTFHELRCAVGFSHDLKRAIDDLIERGVLRRYGVRNSFDWGIEELYICVSHQ
ncbi:hypothetical protein BZM27_12510 [Paraburkholderia steynii]|uniref:Uncharacterized protein n=1 Tax=Paraburkholderia steynii TaxID=1245441 RepID=A0A4R0XP90_9BURK|nr:hypothetical protein BZM27_12510 [Paraburkholderia steynii]